jgi:AhpD family alkylhydroperoxidase
MLGVIAPWLSPRRPSEEGPMAHGKDVLDELRSPTRELRDRIPGVFKAYGSLNSAVFADGALDGKTKELIALAIAVTRQCDGCIASHARRAARQGATSDETAEALGVAVLMNGGPGTVHAPRAFEAFREFAGEDR